MKYNRMTRYTAGLALCCYGLTVSQPVWAQAELEETESEDAPSAEEAEAGAGSTEGSNKATGSKIHVRSTGDEVTVAAITDRMVASAGNVVVTGVAWKDLCITPCSVEMEPGLHELMVYGEGTPSANRKIDLRGDPEYLVVDPGSSGMQTGGIWLTVLGVAAATTGLVFLLLPAPEETETAPDGSLTTKEGEKSPLGLPLVIGGLAGTGVGIGLIIAGGTSFERDKSPVNSADGNAYGLRYSGAF